MKICMALTVLVFSSQVWGQISESELRSHSQTLANRIQDQQAANRAKIRAALMDLPRAKNVIENALKEYVESGLNQSVRVSYAHDELHKEFVENMKWPADAGTQEGTMYFQLASGEICSTRYFAKLWTEQMEKPFVVTYLGVLGNSEWGLLPGIDCTRNEELVDSSRVQTLLLKSRNQGVVHCMPDLFLGAGSERCRDRLKHAPVLRTLPRS